MLRKNVLWTLVSLTAVLSLSLSAPATLRDSDRPLVRTKRADEIIFDSHADDDNSAPVKKFDPKSVPEPPLADDDDPKTKADDVSEQVAPKREEKTVENTEVQMSEDDEADDDENDEPSSDADSKDGNESEGDKSWNTDGTESDDEATPSDEREKRAVVPGSEPLMVAENMAAESADQKLRAKRDLQADEIRELFQSQPRFTDNEYYDRDYAYGDVDPYDVERFSEQDQYDDEASEPWPYDDYYDNDDDEEEEQEQEEEEKREYRDEAEREAVRELLAERAAEEAREALVAYLTSGQPSPPVEEVEEEPIYVIDPVAVDFAEDEDEEYEDEEPERYAEEPELEEKRFYPYSYEPYGGRWGALVPGSKRGDRDPYDRLYRLAEALSRPPHLGDEYIEK